MSTIKKSLNKPENPQAVTDTELVALANVTSAANNIPMYTGSGTSTLLPITDSAKNLLNTSGSNDTIPYYNGATSTTTTPFTSAGRTVLGSASIAAIRTALGLVIGTNVQAQNTNLTTFAGLGSIINLTNIASLTSAANKIPYFTGASTASLLTLDIDGTFAANSDTTIPSQAAVKTGISNIKSTVNAHTRQQYNTPVILSSSSGILNIDCDLHQFSQYTMTESVTLTNSTNQVNGKVITLVIIGAASWTLAINAATWKLNQGRTSLPAPAAGKRLTVSFYSDGTYMNLIGAVYEI